MCGAEVGEGYRLRTAAAKKVDAFLSPDLRHNAADDGLAQLGWAGEIAGAVHDWFAAKAAGGSPSPSVLSAATERLAARQAEIGALVSPTARDLAATRAELALTRDRLAASEHFRTELKDEMAHQRRVLEDAWRADLLRLASTQEELAWAQST